MYRSVLLVGGFLVLSPNAALANNADNWDGLYVGVNGGVAWSSNHWTDDFEHQSISTDTASGAGGGAQLGWDFHLAPSWVLGVQGTFDGGGLDTAVGQNVSCTSCGLIDYSKTSWIATVSARAGFLVEPDLLLYAKGGGAWIGDKYAQTETFAFNVSHSTTRTGYIVGGGLEWSVSSCWSIFVEYDHADFGNFFAADFSDPTTIGQSADAVTAGLNFRI